MQTSEDSICHGGYTLHSLDVGGNGGTAKIKTEILNYSCGAPNIGNENYPMSNGIGGGAGTKRKSSALAIDDEEDEDEDEDDFAVAESLLNGEQQHVAPGGGMSETPRIKSMPPNGKKTKGRVKIKMEFIDNKLRRYTTFSKRKTGIMKKAYELSTLTGTQVMLLVASETGHVYTFATRKLQPMITSESGKALIQTCLNSPDPPSGPGSSGPDQRMSATGFEEVDLTYTVADDTENKQDLLSRCHAYYLGANVSSPSESGQSSGACSPTPPPVSINGVFPTMTSTATVVSISSPLSTMVGSLHMTGTPVVTTSSSSAGHHSAKGALAHGTPKTLSMQLPQTSGFTTILTGGSLSSALQLGHGSTQGGQTVYRLSSGNILSIPGISSQGTTGSGSPGPVTVMPGSPQNLSVLSVVPSNGSPGVSGGVMYQTAQGVVYAPPNTTTLPEGVILKLGQETGPNGQQFITIPVSLTQKQLMQSSMPTFTTSATASGSGGNKRSKHHHKSSA